MSRWVNFHRSYRCRGPETLGDGDEAATHRSHRDQMRGQVLVIAQRAELIGEEPADLDHRHYAMAGLLGLGWLEQHPAVLEKGDHPPRCGDLSLTRFPLHLNDRGRESCQPPRDL